VTRTALTALCDRLERAIDVALVVGGGALCTVVLVNVIARYLLNISLAWLNETGELVFVYLTFVGSAKAVRTYAHLAVLELVDLVPERARRLLFLALAGLTAAILLSMIWFGALMAISNMGQRMSVTGWPVGWLYWSMPVGSVLMLVFVVEQIVLGKSFADPHAAPEAHG
jgi:TRAP-type C4-dicarboxylate transport system permease small subunit